MVVSSLFVTMPPAWPILVLRCLRTPGLSAARENASVILDEAEALLDPVSDIEGFMLACLVDASAGMVLASRKDQDDISLATSARASPHEPDLPVHPRAPADLDGPAGLAARWLRGPGDRAAAPDRRRAQHGNAPVLRPPRLGCHRHLVAHAAHPPIRRPSWSSTIRLTAGPRPDYN